MRVAVYVEADSAQHAFWDRFQARLDYQELYDYVKGFGTLVSCKIYSSFPIPESSAFQYKLMSIGYTVNNRAESIRPWEIHITLDVVNTLDNADMFIFVLRGNKWGALFDWVMSSGKRVILLGCRNTLDLCRHTTKHIEMPQAWTIEDI